MNVLVFVEDPGAVNGILPIAKYLVSVGNKVSIQLEGYARSLEEPDLAGITVISDPKSRLLKGEFDLFFTGTSENLNSKSFRLIKSCKKVTTVSVGFIDSPANPEHRFSGGSSNPLRHVPDYLIVVDSPTAKMFLKFGLKEKQLLTITHPRIENIAQTRTDLSSTSIRKLRETLFGMHSSQGIFIVFCSELSEGLQRYRLAKTTEYTLAAPNNIFKRTDVVIFNFLSVIEQLKELGFLIKTVIRLHPKQTKNDILHINYFDYVSNGGDPIQVCIASDIIVGMSSMILAEAHELRKPVISILPRLMEREWIPVDIRHKITSCFSKEDLLNALQSYITGELSVLPTVGSETRSTSNDNILQFLERVRGTLK